MKFNRTLVEEHYIIEAILGARLSYGSGDKSDSSDIGFVTMPDGRSVLRHGLVIGPGDKALAAKLVKAGRGHSKFLRGIPVSVFVTATTVWWRQLDQHKVGVTTNSESLMHRVASRGAFTADDFGGDNSSALFQAQLAALNEAYRLWSAESSTRRGEAWESVMDKVPANFLYTRQMVTNYEALRGMYLQRRNHRWGEWATFLEWASNLPLADVLIMPEDFKEAV